MKKIVLTIFILCIYMYIANFLQIPNQITLLVNESYQIKTLFGINVVETSSTISNNKNIRNVSLDFLGHTVKNISISTLDEVEVIPVGQIIGLKLYTNGVLIVGMSEIENENHIKEKPFENLDIQEGDMILKVNNDEIQTIENLKNEVNNSKGEALNLTLLKEDGSILTSNIKPVKVSKNEYKLGLWVKDSATGVGTLTYYEPKTQNFAALGHGIVDIDTEKLIKIESGALVTSKVLSIVKGKSGKPGEIRGTVVGQQAIGTVLKNTNFGIYGKLTDTSNFKIDYNNKMKVALRDEIEVGDATVLCSLDGIKIKEYKIKINKIYLANNENNKSMTIEVIDEELLNNTGGIIRGLSGAPIIQNGKFIGAITNVLVNSPTKGYAIFGDIMIKNGIE